MTNFQKIDQIYHSVTTLSKFKSIFEDLSHLNQILYNTLPNNLVPLCHVGAIDQAKNIIIIFVSDSQVLHILKNMSESLLHAFYTANYSFDQLLLKVALTEVAKPATRKPLDSYRKAKLSELAIAIGKPELIIDYNDSESTDTDEIFL